MKISYQQLLAADPALWIESAGAWRRMSRHLDEHGDDLTGRLERLARVWHGGTAADAARASGAGIAARLAPVPAALLEADQLLHRHAERIRVLQRRLAAALDAVRGTPVLVSADGEVSVVAPGPSYLPDRPPAGSGSGGGSAAVTGGVRLIGTTGTPRGSSTAEATPGGPSTAGAPAGGSSPTGLPAGGIPGQADVALAMRVAAEIDAVLAAARDSDEETARRLTALAVEARGAWLGTPVAVPDAGLLEVAAWWAGLTGAQRGWLVLHRPERIGGLDGVPVTARDRANRELLDRELDRLRAVLAAEPSDRDAQARLSGLSGLADRLGQDDPRAYLMRFTPGGDGQAVLAIGDPDASDHVATYVPGVGASLDALGGELDRATVLQQQATALAPGASTSAVMWLGYDPPDSLGALRDDAAQAARSDLTAFQAGLAATHEGEPAHLTLVGHSYGSLTVGVAERDGAALADDIVALGSPGMGVDRADQLGDPAHVWAATARNDVIRLAPSPGEAALGALGGPQLVALGAGSDALFGANADLWHGVDPSSEQFGGQVFASRVGTDPLDAHASYFDADNPALRSTAGIVVGVTPP